MPNLILLFAVPLASAVLLFFWPRGAGVNAKRIAAILSLLPLIILLYHHSEWIGTQVDYDWLPAISMRFHLSVDYLSLIFLYLTAVIIPISILSIRSDKISHPNVLCGLILMLQAFLVGFFTVRDLAVFVIFWEAMLIPLYFVINIWGGPNRQQAALKFIIYMIAGSALMVAAVLGLYFVSSTSGPGTFNLDLLAKVAESSPYAPWLFAIFLLAFAVKTPLFPFHAWLPDAYCQAPTAGTILLAGILSKAGIYGILRINMELFPTLMQLWGPVLLGFAIAGVLYGAFVAWMQTDYKRLIAYSSLSHINFVLVGLFVLSQTAHAGAILQAVNHGITITALFLVAGWLEERLGSTVMQQGGGLAKYMPQLCWLTVFFVLSSVALPGTNNFIGELMILYGLFGENPWLTALLGTSIILSVVYMLLWLRNVYFETPKPFNPTFIDIKARELLIALPLVLLVLWIGIYPAPVLKLVEPASEKPTAVANLEYPQ